MSLVTGGLGQPEQGAIVAGGLGAAEPTAPGAIAGTATGVATCTGTLTGTTSQPPPPIYGHSGWTRPTPRPRPVRYGDMAGATSGTSTCVGRIDFSFNWAAFDDADLELLELV
jgi:hypothetical protein